MITALTSTVTRIRRRWKSVNAKKGGRPTRLAIGVVKWAAIVAGGLWLVYIVAANVALRSQWARNKANANPQTLQVAYASAWTILPGVVHMSKVTGFGQFTGLLYEGQIDHLRINVGMIALLRSRVVLDIHAKGVTLHGRPPASTKPAAPVVDAPIPLRPIEAPPVPVVDESLAKWTIDVDMKISDGRELWVDAVRYAGWLTTELECSLLHAVHDASHALQSLVVEARSALQPVQFVAIVRPARGVMTRSLAKCHSGLGESTPDCAFPCWLSNCSWWPNKQTRS